MAKKKFKLPLIDEETSETEVIELNEREYEKALEIMVEIRNPVNLSKRNEK